MTALHTLNEALPEALPEKLEQHTAALQDLQAHILKGHGRHHAAQVFVVFRAGKQAKAREWLQKDLLPRLTNAWEQLERIKEFKASGKDGGLLTVFHLSAEGYRYLGLSVGEFEEAFQAGMKASQDKLNDPAPSNWEAPFSGAQPIHALILLAHSSEAVVQFAAEALKTELCLDGQSDARMANTCHVEIGKQLVNDAGAGIEHFGYVDGRSQPIFFSKDAKEESDGTSLWDPATPLSQVLVPDPHGGPEASGSYFVFRKLEQDVRGFKAQEQHLANALKLVGADRELAGARVVGRFEDGTPVVLSDKPRIENSAGTDSKNPEAAVPNNFDYRGDPAGAKCPFHAHIRKSNPRGSSPGGVEFDKATQMARRGITYGDRTDDRKTIEDMPAGGVGLLFMAYMQDIAAQFEFIQQSWVNSPDFPSGGVGIDPVIGVSPGSPPQRWVDAAGKEVSFSFEGFVHMQGGEYFFAPSLSFLSTL